MTWVQKIVQLPRTTVVGLALVMIAIVSAIGYHAGPQFGFSIFYLLPIFLVSWSDRGSGFFIAIAAALLWLMVDLSDLQRYSHSWMPFWNAFVRLGFFAIFVYLLTTLKEQMTLARCDGLTGLANRLAFRDAVEREVERSRRFHRPLSIGLLDCDNFKAVNDREGHPTGDLLLCKLASLLDGNCRRMDTVARIGGDEFAILLPETDAAGAHAVIKPMQDAFSFIADVPGVSLRLSAGVVTYLTAPPISGLPAATDRQNVQLMPNVG